MRRVLALFAGLLLIVAACGGTGGENGSDGGLDDTSGSATQPTSGESDSGGDTSGNYAIVTIGGEAFEVPPDPLNGCNSLDNLIFGSFAVGAGGTPVQAGGPDADVQINFGIPVPEWEAEGLQPPNVIVDDNGAGTRYIASVEAGSGSVDQWELSGGQATGSATFAVQQQGTGTDSETETGTFEVVCK